MTRLSRYCCILLVVIPIFVDKSMADCESSWNTLYRLGKTRFYIYDTKRSKDKKLHTDWMSANAACKKHDPSLRMATLLDKVTTNGIISKHMVDAAIKNDFKETFYWISGMYDMDTDFYNWIDTEDGKTPVAPVRYSNFHYQQPRPTGVGGHFGTANTKNPYGGKEAYNKTKDIVQCLTYALPYRAIKDAGWQPSWMEKACIGKTHRRVLCESTKPECEENTSRDPHVLTEDKEYYFTKGNWIFANRKYVVNWKPRQYDDAKKYCEKYGLEVFTPVPADDCLIPYLKLWAPVKVEFELVLSTFHFWTNYTYNADKTEFLDGEGNVIQKGPLVINDELEERTNKLDLIFCASYMWVYEFDNETKCSNCDWMHYILAPSNCNNYYGTICQHIGADNTRACDFRNEWHEDFQQAVDTTAVTEFGYKGSGFWRSTYKQTFGSRICGNPDRQMVDASTEYWKVDPKGVEYQYDYEETYWVVNESLFQHVGKDEGLCTVSTLELKGNAYERVLTKVNCLEWHFYLCESVV